MRHARFLVPDLTAATAKDVVELAEASDVRFLRLQFTDILGVNKNVEIPATRLEKALSGDILFDGSSIEGFVRTVESDMLLRPDLTTFRIFPWGDSQQRVGRLICDIVHPDGTPFPGDPRGVLRRQLVRARPSAASRCRPAWRSSSSCSSRVPTAGHRRTRTMSGSYFDLTPVDLGEDARRAIVDSLEQMGFAVEAAHHEIAPGQHEIDLRSADALRTADDVVTLRFVVRNVAQRFGLHASFMPKPLFAHAGNGMHTHQSLLRDGANAFHDPKGDFGLSDVAHQVHRRPPDPRAGDVCDHQPAGQLVQAARARLRGADARLVVAQEPVAARPCAVASRTGDPGRTAQPGPVSESLSRARGDARLGT